MDYEPDMDFKNFRVFCETLVKPWGFHLLPVNPAEAFPDSNIAERETYWMEKNTINQFCKKVHEEFYEKFHYAAPARKLPEGAESLTISSILDVAENYAAQHQRAIYPNFREVYSSVWVSYFRTICMPQAYLDGTKVMVSLVLNSRDAYTGRVTTLKLGRFIRMYLPSFIPDHVVEMIVNEVMAKNLPPPAKDYEFRVGEDRKDFKFAYTAPLYRFDRGFDFGKFDYARGTEITDVNSLSSCMSPHGFLSNDLKRLYDDKGIVPPEAFASGEFKILYLVHKPTGRVAARSVIRPLGNGKYQRGYIYGTSWWHAAHLSHCLYAKEGVHLGECKLGFTGGTLLSIHARNGEVYAPYFDGCDSKLCTDTMEINGCGRGWEPGTSGTMKDCCSCGGYCEDEEEEILTECDHCGNEHHEDNLHSIEVGDTTEMWCTRCRDNHAFRCNDCNDYFRVSDCCGVNGGDEIVCEGCFENYYNCPDCDEYFLHSEMTELSDGTCRCESCLDDMEPDCGIDFPVRLHNSSHRAPRVMVSETEHVYISEPIGSVDGVKNYIRKTDIGKTYFYCPMENAHFLNEFGVMLLDGRTVWRGHFRVVNTPFGFVEFGSTEYHMTRLGIRPEMPSTITLPLPGRFVQQELDFSPPAAFVDIDLVDLDFQIAHWEAEAV